MQTDDLEPANATVQDVSERMRQLQRASAKSRWAGMSATERSAAMRAVRRRSGRAAKAQGDGQGDGQGGQGER